MKQERLSLRREMQVVDMPTIQKLPSMTRAIVLCADMGGFENDKDFCRKVDLDTTVWARIKDGQRCFPHDQYERLFDECSNEAPLIWLADRRGYELVPKQTEMERRLAVEREARVKAEERLHYLEELYRSSR